MYALYKIDRYLSSEMVEKAQETSSDPVAKIFLKDFDIEENEHFVKNVFIPYFKDVFRDLSERSEKKSHGISKLIFLEVRLTGLTL